jgi:hypothetical protein
MTYNFLTVLENLLEANQKIDVFRFNLFPTNRILQEKKCFSEIEQVQIHKALELRKDHGFSFWESIMATFFDNPEPNFGLLSDALYHNEQNKYFEFSTKDMTAIENFIEKNSENNLAFLSKVSVQGVSAHFPLIDFHIPPSEINQKVVEAVLSNLSLAHGFIINSGKSYHFISTELVSQEKMDILLAKMIFFSPIIDRNWVVHQLIDKACALRVTKGSKCDLRILKRL